MVERRLGKAKAVGSNPIPHSIPFIILIAALFLVSLACSDAAEDLISLAEDLETVAAPTPGSTVRPLDQSPTPTPTKSSTTVPVGTPTLAPTPSAVASGASDEPAGAVFPRHDEAIPANRGDQYVYGELSIAGGCLRISYVDQVDREATRDGLMVVWPMGFGTQTSDGVVEVTGPDGRVVAAAGQTLRLSGKKVSDRLVSGDEWDWGGGEVGRCGGPFWLVGDEVSAMRAGATGSVVDDDIFIPRLYDQRGSLQYPEAASEGRLTLRGRCLLLGIAYPPGEYLVIWPPGFNIQREGDDVLVRNGGGNVIAQVGDHVMLGGRSSKKGADYPGECPGAYFKAYTVQRSPAK